MSDLSKTVSSKDLDEPLKSSKNTSLKKEALMELYQGVEKQVGQGLGLDAAAEKKGYNSLHVLWPARMQTEIDS